VYHKENYFDMPGTSWGLAGLAGFLQFSVKKVEDDRMNSDCRVIDYPEVN